MKYVGFKEYVKAILKTAEYKRDEGLHYVVAISPTLKGCMPQGNNFEEARENLIDAIELWITVTLREGEDVPKINDIQLATSMEHMEQTINVGNATYA